MKSPNKLLASLAAFPPCESVSLMVVLKVIVSVHVHACSIDIIGAIIIKINQIKLLRFCYGQGFVRQLDICN